MTKAYIDNHLRRRFLAGGAGLIAGAGLRRA